jgi:hypothetical protein
MSKRFVFRPLSTEQWNTIGKRVIAEAVRPRIANAINVDDAPAKPLKPGRNGKRGYPDYKAAHGRQPIRDLFNRGLTMRSLRVIQARANQVRIGFDNPQAAKIAAINQIREPMFWFSPADTTKIIKIMGEEIARGKTLVTVVESSAGDRLVFTRTA